MYRSSLTGRAPGGPADPFPVSLWRVPARSYRIEEPEPGAEACETTESRPTVLLAAILAAETLERWSQEQPLAARSLSVPELIDSSRRGVVGSPVEALTEYSRST